MPVGRNSSTRTSSTKATTSRHWVPNTRLAVVLHDAEEQTAEQRAAQVADAAEDGGRERLDARAGIRRSR